MTGTATILRADARALPLADSSVDLVVTSPPYFGLRSYQDGGQHYEGQLGDEPTPAEFVQALLDVTAECMRVLKPTGSMWVNLGDKYVADNRGSGVDRKRGDAKHAPRGDAGFLGRETARQKSLMGIPWRYALACIDQLGLILRAEVIWAKPNGLPESVTDRVRRSHEQWFHFTLQPRYYSAVDEIREPHDDKKGGPRPGDVNRAGYTPVTQGWHQGGQGFITTHRDYNPLGKLPGSVWTIPTQPLQVPDHVGVDHFAAFPMEWPRRIIQGWSPREVCSACGEGRRPVVARGPQPPEPQHRGANRLTPGQAGNGTLGFRASKLSGQEWNAFRAANPDRITGYACACPDATAPTTPGVVLDPFSGTGTTPLVAKALDRHGIGVDLSADYCRLAEWRCNDPLELARAMQAERKPEPQIAGQAGLFD